MGRRLHRFLKSEQLESRRPLAADLAALDVNDDMSVTALDALIIINDINQRSSGSVTTAEAEGQLDCDTNSDGVVTPIDVLNVVNQINTGVIVVPSDSTNANVADPIISTPTDDGDTTVVDENPGDDSPGGDESDDGDTGTDDSDSNNEEDETDGTDDDDDVVSDPNDGPDDDTTGDDTSDDSTDDDTSEDDSDETDDTDDTDTGTDDESNCHHDRAAAERIARSLLMVHGHHGRIGLFDRLDANDDGALSSDEVPEALWEHLSEADADADGSVTQDELQAYREAQREAQRVAAVEAFFEQLDRDDSGAITSTDVPRLVWRFLSRADADSDGAITVDELLAVPLPGRWSLR